MIEHAWDIYTESEERVQKEDAEELARYRAMFPVAPWDDGPITVEACERLGLAKVILGNGTRWMSGVDRVVLIGECGKVLAPVELIGATAGQLACLVAARRAR